MQRHLHRTTSDVLNTETHRSAGDAAINATLTDHPEDEAEEKTEAETGDQAAASPATLRKNEQVLNSRGVRFTAPAEQDDVDVVNMVRRLDHGLSWLVINITFPSQPCTRAAAIQHTLCW
jgi:hypothetical protein